MDVVVALVAVLFGGMGLAALVQPAFIGGFFDVRFESVDGRNEVRAVYGGFGLAMAAALALALRTPELREGIVVCVAFALGGMATGRVLSALVERPGFWPWFFFGVESTGAAVLAYAA
ncbi:MAG: DUF4345 family protein [Sinimarinibacterium sp.]|jgi:hypothetical protein